MTQKESKRKVQVWTHDDILSSQQNYQVTQVTMNMANHFVCLQFASKDYFHSRMSRYPNSVSTFHLIRLFVILEQVPLLKTAIVGLALVASILLAAILLLHHITPLLTRRRVSPPYYSHIAFCLRMRETTPFDPVSIRFHPPKLPWSRGTEME